MTQTTAGTANNPRISLVSGDSIRFYFDSANEADPFTNPANWSERVRITSAGNVGIGTTSPLAKLPMEGMCVTAADTLIKRKRKKKEEG